MHSFKGNSILKMALIVAIMICTFGPGVEGLKCYTCEDEADCEKKAKAEDMEKVQCAEKQICAKAVQNGKVAARGCLVKDANGVKRGYSYCDKDLCNDGGIGGSASGGTGSGGTDSGGGSGGTGKGRSGSLGSNVGLLIGLLLFGISLWFAIGSSISGRLSFSRKH